jgi:hypothetical protein
MIEHFAHAPLLNHIPKIHKDHMVRNPFGLPEDMGDEDNGVIIF